MIDSVEHLSTALPLQSPVPPRKEKGECRCPVLGLAVINEFIAGEGGWHVKDWCTVCIVLCSLLLVLV